MGCQRSHWKAEHKHECAKLAHAKLRGVEEEIKTSGARADWVLTALDLSGKKPRIVAPGLDCLMRYVALSRTVIKDLVAGRAQGSTRVALVSHFTALYTLLGYGLADKNLSALHLKIATGGKESLSLVTRARGDAPVPLVVECGRRETILLTELGNHSEALSVVASEAIEWFTQGPRDALEATLLIKVLRSKAMVYVVMQPTLVAITADTRVDRGVDILGHARYAEEEKDGEAVLKRALSVWEEWETQMDKVRLQDDQRSSTVAFGK